MSEEEQSVTAEEAEELNQLDEESDKAVTEETAPTPSEETLPEEIAPTPPLLKIESFDDIRRIMTLAKGGDPEAQQTLNNFLKFNDNIERTNLPTRKDVQMVAYVDYASKTLYPDEPDNPFALAVNCITIAFMAKGGDKSKQFVELMKQVPSLTDLQTQGAEQSRSTVDKLLGRGKSE